LPGLFGRELRASAITVALSKFRKSPNTWGDKEIEFNQLLTIDNLAQRIANLSERALLTRSIFQRFVIVVCVLLSDIRLGTEIMRTEKSRILRRRSIELLKDLTHILREIIGTDDEERFRRLEETIRAIDESRGKPDRTTH
jgi:hypothetical protein